MCGEEGRVLGPVALQTYCSVVKVIWGEHRPQIWSVSWKRDQRFPVFCLPRAVAAPSLEMLEARFDGALSNLGW